LFDPIIVATCFVIGLIVTFVVSVIPRLRDARKP
jgi:UDP-GlcNAc:undecaprenyl-phosphate GlcNAc-1-phosphate transferase